MSANVLCDIVLYNIVWEDGSNQKRTYTSKK